MRLFIITYYYMMNVLGGGRRGELRREEVIFKNDSYRVFAVDSANIYPSGNLFTLNTEVQYILYLYFL